jgi:hypothetical protein
MCIIGIQGLWNKYLKGITMKRFDITVEVNGSVIEPKSDEVKPMKISVNEDFDDKGVRRVTIRLNGVYVVGFRENTKCFVSLTDIKKQGFETFMS